MGIAGTIQTEGDYMVNGKLRRLQPGDVVTGAEKAESGGVDASVKITPDWRKKAAAATSALLVIDRAGRDKYGAPKCKCRLLVNQPCTSCLARRALQFVHAEDSEELKRAVEEFHLEMYQKQKDNSGCV